MNRAEIEQRLDAIMQRVPAMRDEYPDRSERLMAIAGELDVIEDAVNDAADARYVARRIDSLIAAADVF